MIKIYVTIIYVVLYGCETWYPMLRERYRLGVFKNKVLRRISEPRREEKQENVENYTMSSSSPNIIRLMKSSRMTWAGHAACFGEMSRNAYTVLVTKSEGKSPLGRPRHRWEINTEMDLKRHWMCGLDSTRPVVGFY
jgi:hypothetical protein